MAEDTRPHPRGVEGTGGRPHGLTPTGDYLDGIKCPPFPGLWAVPLEVWAWFVRYTRRRRGLSQLALARAAGVAQQTISKVEAGVICPQDGLKVRLAQALGVPTGDLFPWPAPPVGRPPIWPTPADSEPSDA